MSANKAAQEAQHHPGHCNFMHFLPPLSVYHFYIMPHLQRVLQLLAVATLTPPKSTTSAGKIRATGDRTATLEDILLNFTQSQGLGLNTVTSCHIAPCKNLHKVVAVHDGASEPLFWRYILDLQMTPIIVYVHKNKS